MVDYNLIPMQTQSRSCWVRERDQYEMLYRMYTEYRGGEVGGVRCQSPLPHPLCMKTVGRAP